ncbi:hypothetical protein V3N99_14610 [Dermatophilaceae bacterium Soc4.6]
MIDIPAVLDGLPPVFTLQQAAARPATSSPAVCDQVPYDDSLAGSSRGPRLGRRDPPDLAPPPADPGG